MPADERPSGPETVPADRTSAERVLDRHRDALRERFPLPAADELAPRRAPKKIVAALVFAFAITGLFWLDPPYRTQRFATAIGERQSVQLPDGSRVTLNTDSRLDVAWHLRSRRALLSYGQALFEVERARYRPFSVGAGAAAIRVVGTVFDVRRDGDAIAVTVLSGRVAVGAGGTEVLLSPDERVDVREGAPGDARRVDAATDIAWKDGRLVFERTPLRDVLAELQRYTETALTADSQLAALPVSGVFDTDRGDTLLALLPRILPVRLVRTDDGGVRVEAAHE